MLVQQAIYTSVRTGRNEGYQLAARSPGVTSQAARELAQWGPSHDSLYRQLPIAESVNFHRLEDGSCCVSQTVAEGREYSGRGGPRIYTQMFLIDVPLMQRFGNSPFPIIDALVSSGRFTVFQNVPKQLDPVPLLGRASSLNVANLQYVVTQLGPHKLATLVHAALATPALAVTSSLPGRRLFTALLDLLPPPLRLDFSLTTGLRVAASRPFRLANIPPDRDEQRQAVRLSRLTVLDLTTDVPTKFAAHAGWPLLVYQLLRAHQFSTLASVVEQAAQTAERDADLLAEQVRERLEKASDHGALLTAFPA